MLKLQFAEHNLGIELCFVRHQICRIKTPTYDNLQLARINDIALIFPIFFYRTVGRPNPSTQGRSRHRTIWHGRGSFEPRRRGSPRPCTASPWRSCRWDTYVTSALWGSGYPKISKGGCVDSSKFLFILQKSRNFATRCTAFKTKMWPKRRGSKM